MRRIDVLFGGGGYLGYYLAKLLIDEDHDVFSVDRKHYNKVKGVFNLVGTGPIHEDLERLFELLDGTQEVTLYHLACPRNKKGSWDLDEANFALQQGIMLAKAIKATLVFASSLSVFDDPPSEYGQFKSTAEVAIRAAGGKVVRLGTLFGGSPGGPIRGDLGLHIIANQVAKGVSAWVNDSIRRHITTVQYAATQMHMFSESPARLTRATGGVIKYANIVPKAVKRTACEVGTYYTIPFAETANVTVWRQNFNNLVTQLQKGELWQI